MRRDVIEVSGISEFTRAAKVPLSAAIRANGFVFVSGTPPIDVERGGFVKGDIAVQAEQCLRNLRFILEEAGTSLEKVCMVRVYAKPEHYKAINDVYAVFFPLEPPARTFVPVGDWPFDFDVEIDCVALG
jgi:2-iminobutanoate/2-iminopropanoate deaminase